MHGETVKFILNALLTEYVETPLLLMPGFDSKPDHASATENIQSYQLTSS
jgi:hypothetical protein